MTGVDFLAGFLGETSLETILEGIQAYFSYLCTCVCVFTYSCMHVYVCY